MKFLCVPCDTPMKLQTVGPPERGSLSIVYSCPECGYEMAMLTNAYETQVVQSLGVRIGSDSGSQASRLRAEDASASLAGAPAEAGASGTGCPFSAMIPLATPKPLGEGGGTEEAQRSPVADTIPIRWTVAAEARLAKVPAFVRPMARTGIERFAREKGALEVDEQILDEARDFFGM
jgi:Proto-chlorophyllide reductase 57 kD subunit